MQSSTEVQSRPVPPPDGSGDMFNRIAQRYDLLNRLMSLGLDVAWRRRLVGTLNIRRTEHILDVATGTADVALEIVRQNPHARVTGIDPSTAMLAVGQQKVIRAEQSGRVALQEGDAQDLPFGMHTFDGACISFGIRNVSDRLQAMREMVRVCKPASCVAVLELSEPNRSILAPLVRFHVHTVVPALGAILSGAPEYRYLQRSIAAFPPPDAFMQMMRDAGLDDVRCRALSFGAVYLFCGRVPGR